MAEQFKWVSFYMEFATKLLEYRDDRTSLIEKLQNGYVDIRMKLPKHDKDTVATVYAFDGCDCRKYDDIYNSWNAFSSAI